MSMGQQPELPPGLAANPNIYQATTLSSGAALMLVVWDAFLTLDDEVEYIWSKPGWTHAKWIYLFSRWFGFVNQIGMQLWHSFLATCIPVPVSTCKAFYTFEAVTFQLLQLCLDAILILRIRALYRGDRRYIATAFFFLLFAILTSVISQAIFVPQSSIDATCTILQIPTTTSCIGIGIMTSQSVLLCLTYRGTLLMQPAARRSRIITVVVRDGALVFGVMVGVMLVSLLYLRFNQVVVNVFLPWMPVMPALLTPRMILNIRAAAEPTESVLELTTHIPSMTNGGMQHTSAWDEAVI